jgi:peptidoglycan/LPS O-acetylase OafA/YrhL
MPYSGQLWTIPVELKCSLIAWIVVLGLARTRSTLRISTTFAISVWMFARDHIYPALFVAGPGLAELYLISVSTTETTAKPMSNQDVIPFSHLDHSQALPKPPKETQAQKVKNTFIFLFALHLCSFPAIDGATSLGWPLLAKLAIYLVGTKEDGSISTDTFGYFGSVLLVYSVSQSPWLQRAFSTPLARYLGKISFSLYCVHQPLLNAFGFVNFKFWWELPFLHRNLLFLIAFLIQLAVTVLASDMFYRAVDAPSVVFAKWVESKCTEKK